MPGLIGLGQDYSTQAATAASGAANLEQERNYQNLQIKAAQRQKEGSMAGMGAAIGMTTPLGPLGAAIGAGIGYAVGRIF